MRWESRWFFRAFPCEGPSDQPENVRRVLVITRPEGPRCGFPQPSKQGLEGVVCAPDFTQPLAAVKCFQYRFKGSSRQNKVCREVDVVNHCAGNRWASQRCPGAPALPRWSLRQNPRISSGYRFDGAQTYGEAYDLPARISATDDSGSFRECS